jgi:hypothetical protein
MIFLRQCLDDYVHRAGSADFARSQQGYLAVLMNRITLVSDFQTLSCTIVSNEYCGKAAAIGLAAFLSALTVQNAWAQHTSAPAATNQSAGYEEVLDRADDEKKETYIESYVSLRYRHDQFLEGLNGDELRIYWQQSFGPSGRLAAGIELPLTDV